MHDVAAAPVAASWRRHNRHVNDVACGCARMLTLIQYSTKYFALGHALGEGSPTDLSGQDQPPIDAVLPQSGG